MPGSKVSTADAVAKAAAAAAAAASAAVAAAAAAAAARAVARGDYEGLARDVVLGRLNPDVGSGPEWEQALRENELLYRILQHAGVCEEAGQEPVPIEDLIEYDEGNLDSKRAKDVEHALKTSVWAARDLYLVRKMREAFESTDRPLGVAEAAALAEAEARKAAAAAETAARAAAEAKRALGGRRKRGHKS